MNIRKLLQIVTIVCCVVAFVSCGGGDKSGEKKYDEVAESDASSIIEYTNSVIDELAKSSSWLNSNSSKIEGITDAVDNKSKKLPIAFFITPYINSRVGKDNLTPPSSLSKDDIAFFNENVSAYRATFKTMRENLDGLKKYYEAEDFKDDDFQKGKMLADSIRSAQESLEDLRSAIYDKIDIVANAAEEVVLRDHPLKEPILAAKKDLNAYLALYNDFSDYSAGKIKVEALESAYSKLSTDVEKDKAAYGDALKKENKNSSYDNFYKKFEDEALLKARKILRDAKDGKKVTDNELEDLDSAYESLIRAYNSFID